MKNVISILFAIAMLAITGAAQSQITIESLAVPGLVHDNNASSLSDPSIVASRSHMKFIGSFNPSSSGGCSFPYPQSCRDMRIAFDFGSGLTVGQMISVSTTELRVITPNVPSNGTYPLHIQRNYGGVWVTEIYEASIKCRRNVALPFVQQSGGNNYPVGSLYGIQSFCSGSDHIQALSTSAMPRTYNGMPVFLQLYYTGIHSDDWDDFKWVAEIVGDEEYSTRFDAVYSDGVYVINFFVNNPFSGIASKCFGVWDPGFTAISVALDDDFVVLNPAQYVLNMLVSFQN